MITQESAIMLAPFPKIYKIREEAHFATEQAGMVIFGLELLQMTNQADIGSCNLQRKLETRHCVS